jgi:hypothetical protein
VSTSINRFHLDLQDIHRELLEMGREAPAMMARALNRAGVSGKTAMKKAVAGDTGIAQRAIEKNIKVDKANKTQPAVAITISGAPIPLLNFQGRGPEPSRGKGKGATYRSPAGGRKQVLGGFITKVGKGQHRGIFIRRQKKRLPIVERKTPAMPHWFEKRLDTFKESAQESLVKNLRNDIAFRRSKGTGD